MAMLTLMVTEQRHKSLEQSRMTAPHKKLLADRASCLNARLIRDLKDLKRFLMILPVTLAITTISKSLFNHRHSILMYKIHTFLYMLETYKKMNGLKEN